MFFLLTFLLVAMSIIAFVASNWAMGQFMGLYFHITFCPRTLNRAHLSEQCQDIRPAVTCLTMLAGVASKLNHRKLLDCLGAVSRT